MNYQVPFNLIMSMIYLKRKRVILLTTIPFPTQCLSTTVSKTL